MHTAYFLHAVELLDLLLCLAHWKPSTVRAGLSVSFTLLALAPNTVLGTLEVLSSFSAILIILLQMGDQLGLSISNHTTHCGWKSVNLV